MRIVAFALVFMLATLTSSCGSRDTGTFVDDSPGAPRPGSAEDDYGLVITRTEAADQGSGKADSSAYRLRRTTVGGFYLRRPSGNATVRLRPGMHGKSTAIR